VVEQVSVSIVRRHPCSGKNGLGEPVCAFAIAGPRLGCMNGVDLLVRVGLAVLLGVGIGIERQWRVPVNRPADHGVGQHGRRALCGIGGLLLPPELEPRPGRRLNRHRDRVSGRRG